ncbi:acyltransferase family protein [Nocardioides sp. DS6]|uniref:Acyltransferase family protein n=1 Tax=Nocardioides eburneus TaxID=3231482 RepID=A0ABV3SW30_9ACTN
MTATGVASERPARTARPSSPTRTDIQGLRAIAVSAVVLYHFWPRRLTGGYVGVDVFLVISGFLITTHLLRRPIATGRDLLGFWARRIRRLLPSACLVLAVTLVASIAWAPDTMLRRIAEEVLSAALYVENWYLAWASTDYLAAAEAHTPVQHYWSLSVEEQFYLVWPLLFGAIAFVSSRKRALARWLPLAVTLAVTVCSLAYCVHLTATDPAPAYFVSTARFWELAVGGMLASLVVRGVPWSPPPALRAATAWVGLGMIGWACVVFTPATEFPGWAALLPVLGAAVVIAADADDVSWGPGRLLALRPVQWLGDVSYLIYLWHWPMLVITPFVLGHALAWPEKILLGCLTLLLAAITKRLLEDPVRFSPALLRRLPANFAVLAVCVGLVAAVAVPTIASSGTSLSDINRQSAQAQKELGICYGAGTARHPAQCGDIGQSVLTDPVAAKNDLPFVYRKRCRNTPPYDTQITCQFGAKDPKVRIALVGNSHASHWVPALQRILRKNPDAQVTTYLTTVCYTVDLPVYRVSVAGDCQRVARWQIKAVAQGHYDMVVMSNRTEADIRGVPPAQKVAAARNGYRDALRKFQASGAGVVVVRDTPFMVNSVPDCIAAHNLDWEQCRVPRTRAVEPDPAAQAAASVQGVQVVNMTNVFCDDSLCNPVVGRTIAYADDGHLTASFSRSLAPEICDGMAASTSKPLVSCRGLEF